jgi:F-type H+-transporting ATPase subunit b
LEQLGIHFGMLIAQAANFLILLVILRLLLYRPVMRMLEERRQKIQESLKQADTLRAEAAAAQAEYDRQLEEARRQSQQALTRAAQASEAAREEIIARAQKEAQAIVDRARQEIALEREQALAELRREVADLSVMVSRKVIGEAIDEGTQRRLISEFLAKPFPGTPAAGWSPPPVPAPQVQAGGEGKQTTEGAE